MSKSAILSSSIAKKWWMALTGLFLCLFLVGHLVGNLQLLIPGVAGKRAFNEYAFFMATNPAIKLLSYLTYISILFHAIDGIMLTIQNKKARPVKYAYERPEKNSKWYSRSMAILGTLILVFIATHMQNFWWKAKYSSESFPLHKEVLYDPTMAEGNKVVDEEVEAYYTTQGSYIPVSQVEVKNKTELYQSTAAIKEQIAQIDPSYQSKGDNPKVAVAYKDLHSVVYAFFGVDKTNEAGIGANSLAIAAVVFYVFSMLVLAYHLMHGFASAFQSLGLNGKKFTPAIKLIGNIFAIVVPALFAMIPVYIFLTK